MIQLKHLQQRAHSCEKLELLKAVHYPSPSVITDFNFFADAFSFASFRWIITPDVDDIFRDFPPYLFRDV